MDMLTVGEFINYLQHVDPDEEVVLGDGDTVYPIYRIVERMITDYDHTERHVIVLRADTRQRESRDMVEY